MAQMCGSANMPQSHSCCKSQPEPGNTMVASPDHRPALVLQAVAAVQIPQAPRISDVLYEVGHHRLPSDFLPDTTVLRI
jgi:hypothetical protein